MARLGELLAATRLIEPEQVEQALRGQVVWGGRLGTNLVELGVIELDGLSRALGRQHGLPAALSRHFDKADVELQRALPDELARKYSVVPLLRVGADRKLAIAALDPLPADALVAIADAYRCAPTQIVVSIAAEMRVRYHLERVYGIQRGTRFLRTRGKTGSPFLALQTEIPVFVDEDDSVTTGETAVEQFQNTPTVHNASPPPPANVDDLAAQIDAAIAEAKNAIEPDTERTRDRRRYVQTLADTVEPDAEAGAAALGRMAIKRIAVSPTTPPPVAVSESRAARSLHDATKRIRRGPNRDRVAELVIDALDRFVPTCEAALLLVIRGDVAIGWKHFCRDGVSDNDIAVPLEEPGIVPTAMHGNTTTRLPAAQLNRIDQRLLRALGREDGDLVVIPISIGGRVMCLLAAVTADSGPVTAIEEVAVSAGTAFARLIRDASR